MFAGMVAMLLTANAAPAGNKQIGSSSKTVTLIAGGDIVWTQRVAKPSYYFGVEDKKSRKSNDGWRSIPYVAVPERLEFLRKRFKRNFESKRTHFRRAIEYDLSFANEAARLNHPFQKIGHVFKQADIAFVNLETPLSDSGRLSGAFRMPTAFANTLAATGIDIVSTANNHAFDAEGKGITDTINALKKAGIAPVGTGKNLSEASQATIREVKGQKLAFLAFTYGVNPTITPLGFATRDRSGTAPMDPYLIKAQIAKIRDQVDFVIVSLHWGLENKTAIHPEARKFAHAIIDSGADIILGHHPHVPKGVELYKDGLIVYSMGNLIFGHNHKIWEDNFLVRLAFEDRKKFSAQIIPVAGTGIDITQPYVLHGRRADSVLHIIKQRSALLGTDIQIENGAGSVIFQN